MTWQNYKNAKGGLFTGQFRTIALQLFPTKRLCCPSPGISNSKSNSVIPFEIFNVPFPLTKLFLSNEKSLGLVFNNFLTPSLAIFRPMYSWKGHQNVSNLFVPNVIGFLIETWDGWLRCSVISTHARFFKFVAGAECHWSITLLHMRTNLLNRSTFGPLRRPIFPISLLVP